jgi:hypothetical protein
MFENPYSFQNSEAAWLLLDEKAMASTLNAVTEIRTIGPKKKSPELFFHPRDAIRKLCQVWNDSHYSKLFDC